MLDEQAFRLQFITHSNGRFDHVQGALMALEGGCRWIQLRMKGASDEDVKEAASAIMPACRRAGATFLLDDRVELAMRIGADGVHLGRGDMPIDEARRLMGPGYIIGGTANTIADLRLVCRSGADYAGVGPFRFTTTKERLAPTLGIEGYERLMKEIKGRLPIVAIGGITPQDIPAIMQTGVDGIAISGAILGAEDPMEETKKIINII